MRSWTRPVAAIAAGTILVDSLMVFAGMRPHVMLIAALCVLVGVGLWFIADAIESAGDSTDLATGPTFAVAERTDRAVMRLRSGLLYGRHDDTPLERLRASLVELVDDQLRAAHQIDRFEDPDMARAVLGDELSAFVDDPRSARDLSEPRELDRILTLIEQI